MGSKKVNTILNTNNKNEIWNNKFKELDTPIKGEKPSAV